MRRFWDARAREDALHFVDSREPYKAADPERFWEHGERDLRTLLDAAGVTVRQEEVVLDLGCGVGRLTRVLARRAAHVIALDVSPEMLRRAQELNAALNNVTWLLGDGESLTGIEDASLDGAVSHVVFQHIPDAKVTLGYVEELARVLTAFSVIILPLTLIASTFGMNVAFPGEDSEAAFWVILGVMVVTLVGMVAYFRKRGFL